MKHFNFYVFKIFLERIPGHIFRIHCKMKENQPKVRLTVLNHTIIFWKIDYSSMRKIMLCYNKMRSIKIIGFLRQLDKYRNNKNICS